MKEQFVNAFLAPAKLVWQAELSQTLELIGAKLASRTYIPQDVTAIVGISGELKGCVRYEFGKGTSLAVASTMMGESLEEHNEISMSALGEIANMITGNAAANLYDHGFTCEITPPEMCEYGSKVPDRYPGLQILASFTSELGKLNIRIGLSETGINTETAETFELPDVESPLDKYTTRVQDVLGLGTLKKGF